MKFNVVWGMAVVALAGGISGCGQTGLPGVDDGAGSPSGKIELPQIVGRYVIAAGQEKQSKAIMPAVSLREADESIMLRLLPGDISFAPASNAGGTMRYAVAFGVVSNFAEACAEPVDSYSPFAISVSADGRVTNVAGAFEIPSETIELIRSGSYTICTTYSSNVAGTIIVGALTLD